MTLARLREKEFWILIASGLLLFYRPLFLGDTFYFRDLHLHFFPQKLRFAELIRSGEFPLWDPYLHGGQPFLADLNNMALYPINLIYLILPPLQAFNFDIIFHVLLCAAAAYWLARSLQLSAGAALIAGGVYAFCGYTLSLTNLLSRLSAMPYLPLILLALQQLFSSNQSRWFVLAALFGAFQVFAGAPEMTVITFLTVGAWLFVAEWRAGAGRRIAAYVALALLVAGLTAIQTLPAAEMVQQSVRSDQTDYDTFSAWSLHPKRIPEIIFPGFFGYTDRASNRDYWGSGYESMGFPFILSIYFGWFALTLSFCGVLFSGRHRRFCLLMAALAAGALLFSMGRYLPGFRTLYDSLPFAGAVRYPVKVLAAGLLPLALLSAFGFDGVLQAREAQQKRMAIYFWCAAALFVILAFTFRFSQQFATSFTVPYFGSSTGAVIKGIRDSLLHTAVVAILAACLYQYSVLRNGRLLRGGFAALLLFDLIRSGFGPNHYAPDEFFTLQPRIVEAVKREIGSGRFYRAPNPPDLMLKLPSNDVLYVNRWHLETLHNYSAPLYSIPIIYHEDFDNLAQKELVELSDSMLRVSQERRLQILSAGGVSVFLTPDRSTIPSLQPLSIVRSGSDRNFYLYRNLNFKGVAHFVPEAMFINDPKEALVQVTGPGFDPSKRVYLQGSRSDRDNIQGACEQMDLRMVRQRATGWSFQSRSDCDAYVYFAQPFYNGWITLVDGKEVPTLRANYAFSASFVEAGEHAVDRVYRSRSVRIGFGITLFAVLLLIVFAFCYRN
jgi:hypothetical protein